MIFTIVHSKPTDDKFPISTTEDPKIFDFQNIEIFDLRDVANAFKKYFILNFPLKHDTRTRRKASSLNPLTADSCEYMILDFNDVKDQDAREQIISRFKIFKHIAFKSRNTDDVFSFNFRIILKIPASTRTKIRKDLLRLSNMLDPKLAKINTSLYNKAQVTAAGNRGTLSHNEDGLLFTIDLIKDASCWKFTPDVRDAAILLFKEIGLRVSSNTKDSVILTNPEIGDFIFFDSNPFEATNVQTGEKINISKEFKRRFKLDDFRVTVPVKELLDWSNKERIFEEKVLDLSNFDSKAISKDITECIKHKRALVLRSPMGSGKTRAIREFMAKSNSCLIITPRVSLAEEFYERFKEDGAKIYNKHKLDSDTRIFICQFDSLYKIDFNSFKFDSVIIDEFMSLSDHIISSVALNREFNTAKLLASINSSKALMVCDAFMERITLDLIPSHFKEVVWITNESKDSASILIHKDLGSFLHSMSLERSAGVVVSCVSISAGIQIKDYLESAGFSVGLINANTSVDVREKILFEYRSTKLNALVYSPSVSVGVNVIGLRGSHFHYDPGNVIPVIQSVQMLRRSRNSERIECFIKKNPKNFIPSLQEEKFNALSSSSAITYNSLGDRILSDVGSFIATLNFHSKIWNVDRNKMFARLCSMNFRSVSSLDNCTDRKINLRALPSHKEHQNLQKLEIFGSKALLVQERISLDDVDTFLEFEKFFRIANRLEGYELAHSDLVKQAIFNLQLKLELFNKLQTGIDAKEYASSEVKLPDIFVQKRGFIWLFQEIGLNSNFLETCKLLHNLVEVN